MTPAASEPREDLPPWLWLVFPPLILPVQVLVKAWSEDAYMRWIRTESGLVEVSTVIFLLVALATGVRLWLARASLPDRRLGPWLALLCLGCLYFAGEEASWGQHLFGWGTPEALAAVNDQKETNIHNIWGGFDQTPRMVLTLACLVGGVLAPIVRRRNPARWAPQAWMTWIWPTVVCLPTALLVLTIRFPERIVKVLGNEMPRPFDLRIGESEEYFFALFLMFYMLSLRKRLRSSGTPSAAPAPAAA